MDQDLVLENSGSAAVYTLPNSIIYLKALNYLHVRPRQIIKLKLSMQKSEDQMLYYGCKDSGLLFLKLKTLW